MAWLNTSKDNVVLYSHFLLYYLIFVDPLLLTNVQTLPHNNHGLGSLLLLLNWPQQPEERAVLRDNSSCKCIENIQWFSVSSLLSLSSTSVGHTAPIWRGLKEQDSLDPLYCTSKPAMLGNTIPVSKAGPHLYIVQLLEAMLIKFEGSSSVFC